MSERPRLGLPAREEQERPFIKAWKILSDKVKTIFRKEQVFNREITPSNVAQISGKGNGREPADRCFDRAMVLDNPKTGFSLTAVFDGTNTILLSEDVAEALKQEFTLFAAEVHIEKTDITSQSFQDSIVQKAIFSLQKTMDEIEDDDYFKDGGGSTLTVSILDRQRNIAILAQAGDSLGFHLPKASSSEKSFTRTPIQVDSTNELANYIGINPDQSIFYDREDYKERIHFQKVSVEEGDILFNCTDGVEKYLLIPLGLQLLLEQGDTDTHRDYSERIKKPWYGPLTDEEKDRLYGLAFEKIKQEISKIKEQGSDIAHTLLRTKLIKKDEQMLSAIEYAEQSVRPPNNYHDDMSLTITVV